ncbi:MAG TPA: DoxX family protein [Acidocella sp.]|nr:DoxX family protein [Acidocella sp.]
MRATHDIFFLAGRVALGIPFLAEGLRQLQAWPGIVGLFRHAGGPYPLVLALVTVAVNLVAPVLIMLGIRARPAALVLAAVTAMGLHLLHRVDIAASAFQSSIALIGGLLLVAAAGSGRYAMEPGR